MLSKISVLYGVFPKIDKYISPAEIFIAVRVRVEVLL